MTPAWIALVALSAGSGEVPDTSMFEAPTEVTCASKTFENTLYPSPVMFDLDGDGTDELIVGDLMGFLHTASRESEADNAGWGKVTKMKDAGGNDLKFDNW